MKKGRLKERYRRMEGRTERREGVVSATGEGTLKEGRMEGRWRRKEGRKKGRRVG